MPANTEPTKNPIVLYPRKINETKIPGSIA